MVTTTTYMCNSGSVKVEVNSIGVFSYNVVQCQALTTKLKVARNQHSTISNEISSNLVYSRTRLRSCIFILVRLILKGTARSATLLLMCGESLVSYSKKSSNRSVSATSFDLQFMCTSINSTRSQRCTILTNAALHKAMRVVKCTCAFTL